MARAAAACKIRGVTCLAKEMLRRYVDLELPTLKNSRFVNRAREKSDLGRWKSRFLVARDCSTTRDCFLDCTVEKLVVRTFVIDLHPHLALFTTCV